ncbi:MULTISPECIES: hypothetical protein [Candidatus Ichthyocystis]|uniref:Putative membrane protein n=1 Tax=Candidatus Ichthyocystis hellenicum TaxID=1561003 RepID=A0A0S4M1V4_9BURK|nr:MULTISPECIES: hypothetical protein [Ichthyocystis]CUT17737.1 putative membrane protein [Candidatus Ichthyocystis hellenicum]
MFALNMSVQDQINSGQCHDCYTPIGSIICQNEISDYYSEEFSDQIIRSANVNMPAIILIYFLLAAQIKIMLRMVRGPNLDRIDVANVNRTSRSVASIKRYRGS